MFVWTHRKSHGKGNPAPVRSWFCRLSIAFHPSKLSRLAISEILFTIYNIMIQLSDIWEFELIRRYRFIRIGNSIKWFANFKSRAYVLTLIWGEQIWNDLLMVMMAINYHLNRLSRVFKRPKVKLWFDSIDGNHIVFLWSHCQVSIHTALMLFAFGKNLGSRDTSLSSSWDFETKTYVDNHIGATYPVYLTEVLPL